MKRIAILHAGKAILPEIWAYQDFFKNHGYEVEPINTKQDYSLEGYDIEWHLMGTDISFRNNGRIKIHEYISLSTQPFPAVKNGIKRLLNTKPHLRLFGSPIVKRDMGFRDEIPFLFRDAGVAPFFFDAELNASKEFDFVYAGSTHKSRRLNMLLEAFIRYAPENNLLIIGEPSGDIRPEFLSNPNILYTGRVKYQDVPGLLRKAHFGLNYIPDIYPLNIQRPLKLLEYCAVGLPVVSTSYFWVNQFEKETGARFYKLNQDLSNLNINAINYFEYNIPDISVYSWENIIIESGIVEWLDNFKS